MTEGTKHICKSIVKTICFLIIASVVFVMTSYAVKPHYADKDRRIFAGFYGEKDNTVDMVYIGGSAAFVFWEPMRAWNSKGYATCLLGNNALQPTLIKYCVKEALRSQNPELLLIDVRPFIYGCDTSVSTNYSNGVKGNVSNTITQMSYSVNRLQAIYNTVPMEIGKFPYVFDIVGFRDAYSATSLLRNPMLIFNRYHDPYKGFVFIDKHCEETFTDQSAVTEKAEISEELKPVLEDLLDYLKTLDKDVLFVVHSYCISRDDQMKYNYLEQIITENGFNFLNCNNYCSEIELDYSRDFYNENHVNIFGADKYTDFLAEYLDKNYTLPDRRSDPDYSSWSSDYKTWISDHKSHETTIEKLIQESEEK